MLAFCTVLIGGGGIVVVVVVIIVSGSSWACNRFLVSQFGPEALSTAQAAVGRVLHAPHHVGGCISTGNALLSSNYFFVNFSFKYFIHFGQMFN